MDDIEKKENQMVLEKQKLRNTRRQERSELLREYQKKYKKGGLWIKKITYQEYYMFQGINVYHVKKDIFGIIIIQSKN